MSEAQFSVLIIEDDIAFGSALVKVLAKHKISAQHVSNPEAAISVCQHEDFDCLIVDCMLPRLDGVTLVQNLKQQADFSPQIVLMTGIFKDRAFLKDAENKTGASLVLSKPFNNEKLVEFLQKQKGKVAPKSNASSVLEFLASDERIKTDAYEELINDMKTCDGRELPFILSLGRKIKATGGFHILLPNGKHGAIFLEKGEVNHVHLDDARSLFGHILMDLGYLEPEDLETALKTSDSNPIGKRLVDQLSISPHAVDLALSEQSVIRLSQLVVPDFIEVKFIKNKKNPLKNSRALSEKRLTQLFRDWSDSKLDKDYLENYLGDACADRGHELQEAAFLILTHQINLDFSKTAPKSLAQQKVKLQTWINRMKNLDDFQILGITKKVSSADVQRAFNLLVESYKKNYVEFESSKELSELHAVVGQRLKNAFENLKDDSARTRYLKELDAKAQMTLLEREPELVYAVGLLGKKDFSHALEMLRVLHRENLKFKDLTAYLLVAEAYVSGQPIREAELGRIPPENRHSPGFLVAKGLCLKAEGNFEMAIQAFKKALVYEPSLKVAEREIRSCLRKIERRVRASGPSFSLGSLFGKGGKKAG